MQKNSILEVLITFFFNLVVFVRVHIDCDSITGPELPAQAVLNYIRCNFFKSARPRKLEEVKSEEQNVQYSSATTSLEEECSHVIEPGPQTVGHGDSENESTRSVKLAGVRQKLDLAGAVAEKVTAFIQFLEDPEMAIFFDGITTRNLIVAAECHSLSILDELWKAHCSGFLNEKMVESLVTEDVLETFGLTEVKLKATIHEEEYKACRNAFLEQGAGGYTLMENCLTLTPIPTVCVIIA